MGTLPIVTIISAYCVARLLSVPYHPPTVRVFLFDHEGLVWLGVRLAAVAAIALSWWQVREHELAVRERADAQYNQAVLDADDARRARE